MDRIETILENMLPGDILLTRKIRDKTSEKKDGVVRGYWRQAFLCLENERILCCFDGKVYKNKIQALLIDKDIYIGVFRVKKDLTVGEFSRICFAILDKLMIEYNGFHFMFNQEELIQIGYKEIGVKLTDLQGWEVTPSDIDESLSTIRIV